MKYKPSWFVGVAAIVLVIVALAISPFQRGYASQESIEKFDYWIETTIVCNSDQKLVKMKIHIDDPSQPTLNFSGWISGKDSGGNEFGIAHVPAGNVSYTQWGGPEGNVPQDTVEVFGGMTIKTQDDVEIGKYTLGPVAINCAENKPEIKFFQHLIATCTMEPYEVDNRVQNLSTFDLDIYGSNWAVHQDGTEFGIGYVAEGNGWTGPNQWGGPTGRVQQEDPDFVGTLYSNVKVATDNQVISVIKFSIKIDCRDKATNTPTVTNTVTVVTETPTSTPNNISTTTPTPTKIKENTPTPTVTQTVKPNDTPSMTPTPTASLTPNNTSEPSITPSSTPSPSVTSTLVVTDEPTNTPTVTPTPTEIVPCGSEECPTPTDTSTVTPTATATQPLPDTGIIKVCKIAVVPNFRDIGEVGFWASGWEMSVKAVGTNPQKTNGLGCTEFIVQPGTYRVYEENRAGWVAEIGPTTTVPVSAGETVIVVFKNKEIPTSNNNNLYLVIILVTTDTTPTSTPTPQPEAVCPLIHHKSSDRQQDGPISPGQRAPVEFWVDNTGNWSHAVWLINQVHKEEIEDILYENLRCSFDRCSSGNIHPTPGSQLLITIQLYGGEGDLIPTNCGKLVYVDPPSEETPPEVLAASDSLMLTLMEVVELINEAFTQE